MSRARSVPSYLKPAPVFLDMDREYSREKRRDAKDYYNMLLDQIVVDNGLRPERWKGHGFKGHVQYIPYIGHDPIRPGEKLTLDIQCPTFPHEMSRPLNRSQMPRATIQIRDFDKEKEDFLKHNNAMRLVQDARQEVSERDFKENAFNMPLSIGGRQKELNELRTLFKDQVGPCLRSAGLSSINPTLGTVGASEDLRPYSDGSLGPEILDKWRNQAPYAYDKSRNKIYDLKNDPY